VVNDDLARAEREEHLRQVRETFDQRRDHNERWFSLRATMGWAAVVLLPCISGVAAFVLVDYRQFDAKALALAGTALVSSLGLFAAAWRLILSQEPPKLSPVGEEATEAASPGASHHRRDDTDRRGCRARRLLSARPQRAGSARRRAGRRSR
jgi:hypothetical protein